MSTTESDVLIVGAGASGLTLACDLRRRGISCRIVEKLEVPFPGSRGKGLQPRTLEVFDDLGIAEAITAAGGPFPPFRGRIGERVLWEKDLASVMGLAKLQPDETAPYSMWMVPQYATEAVLRARLADLGGNVEMGTEVVACVPSDSSVEVTTRARGELRTTRFAYVVGADGGRSFIRHTLGLAFTGESGTYRSVIADVEVEGLERGWWHIWTPSDDPLERVTMCSLPGTELFQFSAPIDTELSDEPSLAFVADLFASRTGGFPIRWKRMRWSTRYRLNARLAERFQVGRVFLIGDAAHVHSPFGGQGINTSIQDAYNLGWKLAAALRGRADLLASYEAERQPVAADVLGLSSAMHRENYGRIAASDLAEGNRDIYQLRTSYRGGALSKEYRANATGIRAGDRAPDAPCSLASGMPTRLFERFRGPSWTVLTFGVGGDAIPRTVSSDRVRAFHVCNSAQPDDGRVLVDASSAVRRAYGVEDGADATFVVRPDGYIGMATDREGLARTTAYLSMMVA